MKSIVYATDYSDHSAAALSYAAQLAKAFNASLKIIHVFDYPTVLGTKTSQPFPNLEGDAYREHEKALKQFTDNHLGNEKEVINYSLEVMEHKNVLKALSGVCSRENADLLVVGMQGQSAARDVIMGNTAKKLVAHAPCPVLSIPADASFNGIRTIVYATDLAPEDILIIQKLIEWAEALEAEVKVVHMVAARDTEGPEAREDFARQIKAKISFSRFTLDYIYADGVFEEIRVFFGDAGADIAAMLERNREHWYEKVFHRDKVKHMESYGRIPLLTFHQENFQPTA